MKTPAVAALISLVFAGLLLIGIEPRGVADCSSDCSGCGSPSAYENVPVCGECVHFADQYIKAKYGITMPGLGADGCAYQMWGLNVAGMVDIANDGTNWPQQGDILIWNAYGCGALSCGHVAVVDSATSRSNVAVVESNWTNPCLRGHSYHLVVQ